MKNKNTGVVAGVWYQDPVDSKKQILCVSKVCLDESAQKFLASKMDAKFLLRTAALFLILFLLYAAIVSIVFYVTPAKNAEAYMRVLGGWSIILVFFWGLLFLQKAGKLHKIFLCEDSLCLKFAIGSGWLKIPYNSICEVSKIDASNSPIYTKPFGINEALISIEPPGIFAWVNNKNKIVRIKISPDFEIYISVAKPAEFIDALQKKIALFNSGENK